MFALFSGLGQNAFGLTLGTAAAPATTVNEGLGGIDFSSSSDKKSMFFLKYNFVVIEIRNILGLMKQIAEPIVIKIQGFPVSYKWYPMGISFLEVKQIFQSN